MRSVLLAIALASVAHAKVAPTTLKALVAGSERVVLATVTNVEQEDGVRVATARVDEEVVGTPSLTVRYLSESTWTCDITGAKVGEQVVLFLSLPSANSHFEPKRPGLLVVLHAGRGRMELRDVDGQRYATVWVRDVVSDLATSPGPRPGYDFIRSVKLGELLVEVRRLAKAGK